MTIKAIARLQETSDADSLSKALKALGFKEDPSYDGFKSNISIVRYVPTVASTKKGITGYIEVVTDYNKTPPMFECKGDLVLKMNFNKENIKGDTDVLAYIKSKLAL